MNLRKMATKILIVAFISTYILPTQLFNQTHAAGFNTDCSDTATTEISQIECEALGAMYNSLNGDSWNNNTNWGTTGTSVKTWFGLLFTGANLTRINLQYNGVVGILPTEIGNFTSLQQLFLSGNSISGTLPQELGNVTTLTSLRVDVNNMSGNIPASFSNLINLQEVRFHRNDFSGTLDALGGQANLNWMYLEENNFHGEVPSGILSRPNMRVFRANTNHFIGAAPEFISSGMTTYKIANNHFDHIESDTNKEAIINNLTWYNAIGDRSRNMQSFIPVTIEQATSQIDPTTVDSVIFDIVFDEAMDMSTFTTSDITFSGSTTASVSTINEVSPNDGTSFQIVVNGLSNGDTVEPILEEGNVLTLLGVKNYKSTSVDNSVTFTPISNNPPTDIALDNSSISENSSLGDVVGSLTSSDVDQGHTHTYTLISGGGDEDNSLFTLSGSQLVLKMSPDYENPVDTGDFAGNNTYSIRVETDDGNGGTYEKIMIISIIDIDEIAPLPPVITSHNNGDFISNNLPIISGTGEVGSTIVLTIDGVVYTTGVDGSGNWSVPVTSQLLDDNYDIIATQTDSAGNVSLQTQKHITVDTIKPIISFIDGIDPSPALSDIIEIITTDDNLDVTTLQYGYVSNIADCTDLFTAINPYTNNNSFVSNSVANNGKYICAIGKDFAGNIGHAITLNSFQANLPPIIELVGSGTVNVSQGATYSDSGALFIDDVDGTGALVGSGIVDTNTLGAYSIAYNYTDSSSQAAQEVTRSVLVIDTTVPALPTIKTPEGTTIAEGTAEPFSTVSLVSVTSGVTCTTIATVSGTYACDMGPAVVSGEDVVITSTDNSGNYSSNYYQEVFDFGLPTLALVGNPIIVHTAGTMYTDAGAVFTDNVDGTGPVVTGDTVNTSTPGTYTLTYNYTDVAGNVAQPVTRTVTVVAAVVPDTTLPTLTLVGNPTITHIAGTAYTDAGALFMDNVDGTGAVVTGNTVDTSTPGTYTLTYNYTDAAGNLAQPVTRTVIVMDNDAPVMVEDSLQVNTGGESVTISWETNEKTSTQIIYGLTTVVNNQTQVADIAPRVNTHSATLTGLSQCTKYYYYTVSVDAYGNEAKEGIYDFITSGCSGNAEVLSVKDVDVVLNTEGTNNPIELQNAGKMVKVDVPAGFSTSYLSQNTCNGQGAYFQFKEIDKIAVENSLGKPDNKGKTLRTYDLSAYCTPNKRMKNFDQEIEITSNYLESELGTEDESNLAIFRYDEIDNEWKKLNNCSVNTTYNTVTCTTNHFSTFGVFSVDVEEVEQQSNNSSTIQTSQSSGSSSKATFTVTCAKNNLICSKNESGVYKYSRKEGISCEGGLLGESCTHNNEDIEESMSLNSASEKLEVDNNSVLNNIDKVTDNVVVHDGVENNIGKNESTSIEIKGTYDSCPILKNLHTFGYENNYLSQLKDIDNSNIKNLILRLEKAGVVDGTVENLFEGDRDISRIEFIKIVLRSHCIEYRNEDPSSLSFSDMDNSTWQAKVAKKAFDLGIADGDVTPSGQKVFRADEQISKIEATKILMNMAIVQKGEQLKGQYRDVNKTWHKGYVQTGEYLNIFDPEIDNYVFRPESYVTRESMIDLLYKVTRLYKHKKLVSQ